ncbi:MAG: tetratricopeptide repeat protein [Bryobacteraceae bacterium]
MGAIGRTALFFAAVALLRAETCVEGRNLFASREYLRAQSPLWECVIFGAPDREFAHRLALTYRDLKNYESGVARAESALASNPKSPDCLYILGFLHFRLGRHKESIDDLTRAYRLDEDDWRVYQLFALNYVVLDIKDGALASFKNAIRLNPDNAELYYQLARFYYSDNRPDESIKVSRRALAIFPDYPEVLDNLGLCYASLGRYDEARANFEQSIAVTEKTRTLNEWPYLDYATFLIKQDYAEASLPLLQAAIQMNPASAKAYYFRGRALRKLGRDAEAKQSFEKSMALDPNDPPPYYELGMLLNRLGDAANGRAMLKRFENLRARK